LAAGQFVGATEGDDMVMDFETFMSVHVGDGRTFDSASVWRIAGGPPERLTLVGERTVLAQRPVPEILEVLDVPAAEPEVAAGADDGAGAVHLVDLLDSGEPRLG